ncbi:MAG: hypothetical protein KKH04_14230 [Proteobacteria bacterium]|nr:hypothetical protein [Pseudomonadota bacterium]
MTHSLHRSGKIESLRGDYVWLMYQAKGINDKNIKEKAKEFIAVAEAVGSENWGDVKSGPKVALPVEEIKNKVGDKSRLRGVFTKKEQVVQFLRRIREKELGISVIISGLLEETLDSCKEAGLTPHTINFSLGVWGKKELLPSEEILALTTMCGHHMIPPGFVAEVMEQAKQGKMSPEEGGLKLALFCPCGIFNQVRAAKLLGA